MINYSSRAGVGGYIVGVGREQEKQLSSSDPSFFKLLFKIPERRRRDWNEWVKEYDDEGGGGGRGTRLCIIFKWWN